MTEREYKRQRSVQMILLLMFTVMFAMVLPGRDSRIGAILLILIGGCILIVGFQLAALLMNGADDHPQR